MEPLEKMLMLLRRPLSPLPLVIGDIASFEDPVWQAV